MADAPSYVKQIVCLANSRKLAGRCIAGKEWNGRSAGPWIRPVSMHATGELSEDDRRFSDGSEPELGDVLAIPFKAPLASAHQSENHLIDDGYHWEKKGRLRSDQLSLLVDDAATLFENDHSGYHGINDRVPLERLPRPGASLLFVKIDSPTLYVSAPGASFGNPKRKVRAKFKYRGERYDIGVTDAVLEKEYLRREDGEYQIQGDCHACISLGEEFKGYAYKLVASLIMPARL